MATSTEQMIQLFKESNALEKILIDNADDALYFYSMEGKLIYVNPAFEKITGFTTQDLYEKNFIPFVHPEDEEWTMNLWEGLYRGEFFEDVEYRIRRKNGDIRWSSSSWKIVSDGEGIQIGIQGKQQDITARKHTEIAQQLSLKKLQEFHNENTQQAVNVAALPSMKFDEKLYVYKTVLDALRKEQDLAIEDLPVDYQLVVLGFMEFLGVDNS